MIEGLGPVSASVARGTVAGGREERRRNTAKAQRAQRKRKKTKTKKKRSHRRDAETAEMGLTTETGFRCAKLAGRG